MNKEVRDVFKVVCNTFKKPFILDHAPIYGGYVIEEEANPGISHPFGSMRRNKAQMMAFMRGLIEGVGYIKYQQMQDTKQEG